MENFCEIHAPGLFEDMFQAIFNDEKETPREASKHQYTPPVCFSTNEERCTAKECRANWHLKNQFE